MSTVDESLVKIVVLESSSDFNCMKGFLGDIGSAFNSVVLSGPELFSVVTLFSNRGGKYLVLVPCEPNVFSRRDLVC